jgi:hypothetical protein
MYYSYLQTLAAFAVEFANGFVLENEPIYVGVYGGSIAFRREIGYNTLRDSRGEADRGN